MRAIRVRLIQTGLVVPDGSQFRLTEDQLFGSPSTAAGVLLGRPASGPIEWKDAGGRTLKQLRESAAGPAAGAIATTGKRLNFHEAMALVLQDNGNSPMPSSAIAAEINRRSLYTQRTGARVPAGQISARLAHYQELFERTADGIRLRDGAGTD